MSEVMKLPLILGAISTIGGGTKEIMPVFREAVSKPFANVWISLAYTFNNLLYFDALSSISAVTYQARAPQPTRRLTMAGPGGSTAAHHGSPRLTTAHRCVRSSAAGALAIEDLLHRGAHALPSWQEANAAAAACNHHARDRRCLGTVPGALPPRLAHRHRDVRLHLLGVRPGELPPPSPTALPSPSTLSPFALTLTLTPHCTSPFASPRASTPSPRLPPGDPLDPNPNPNPPPTSNPR